MKINLLPPALKEQFNFARRNVVLRRYLLLVITLALLLGTVVVGANWYSNRQQQSLEQTFSDRQKQRSAYRETEAKLQALQSNVGLIEKLFAQKAQFSGVLQDLAAVLPSGTYINNIALTGDDKKPLKLVVTASSFTQAGLVKNALLKSPRIQTVDIQNINKEDSSNNYKVDLVIAFKEGQAR